MALVRYFLPKHLFVCICANHVVLLDVKRQRYRAFDAKIMDGLGAFVSGWPASIAYEGQASAEESASYHALAQDLVSKGILCEDAASGKSATPINVAQPISQLIPTDDLQKVPVRARVALSLLVAFLVSAARMRLCSFEQIVRWASKRNGALKKNPVLFDIGRARELMAMYLRLRAYFFAPRDACMFECMVLIAFLSRYGIHADWVFGVRMDPWLAHCWLQHGSIVLSDSIEHVSVFTPIMTAQEAVF